MDDGVILKAEDLTKEFDTGHHHLKVLDRVQLAVRSGDSLSIIGPSGSGKSTLLGLLAGLDTPSRGRVILSGLDLAAMDEDELTAVRSRRVGFIFQSYRLLRTLTAEENVRVPLELAGDPKAVPKARAWLDKVGLSDRLEHLPAQLSGGEQQRVALARALAPEPDVLFADEPTGNLDSKTGAEMAELIFSLVRQHGTTLVLVTHELSLARRADRILELKDGKIVREAPSSQW